MKRVFPVLMATAFATSSALAVFVGSGQQAQLGGTVAFLSGAPQAAFADGGEGERGNNGERGDNGNRGNSDNCVNPAGHKKGWCKHGENDDNQGDGKHRHRQHGSGSYNTISGTVTQVNGTTATIRLDNGQYVTVQENGTVLNVGQHYNLNGCYQNNVFVLGCYANNNYPTGNNQQISGTILSVNGNSLTLAGIPPVTIDISRAVSSGQVNGQLVPLRHVTIYGYYQNGVFYATSIR